MVGPVSRRRLIRSAAGLPKVDAPTGPTSNRGLLINPRRSWGANRPPRGPLDREEVRFLIVHHSASRNGHAAADVPEILGSFYDYHTGPEKGWNDIAYNFLIDAEGGVWEGRFGSIDGPVAGDATGGNQGFTQLVCIIGDYDETEPSTASLSSLVSLLAWLADRYEITTAPGAKVTFTSRGSNRHPKGESITTPTITGHRTMSRTSCPGDNLNSYVEGELMRDVAAARAPVTTTTARSATTTTAAATITSTSTTSTPAETTIPVAVDPPGVDSGGLSGLMTTVGAVLAGAAGILLWRYRRMGNS